RRLGLFSLGFNLLDLAARLDLAAALRRAAGRQGEYQAQQREKRDTCERSELGHGDLLCGMSQPLCAPQPRWPGYSASGRRREFLTSTAAILGSGSLTCMCKTSLGGRSEDSLRSSDRKGSLLGLMSNASENSMNSMLRSYNAIDRRDR